MAAEKKVIFLIGATGAQGGPVVKELLRNADDGTPSPYRVRALTRNPDHRRAKDLEEMGVELVKGAFYLSSHDTNVVTMLPFQQAISWTSQRSAST